VPACHVLLSGRLQVICTANASQVFALTGELRMQAWRVFWCECANPSTGLAILCNPTTVRLQAGCALLCVCLLLEDRSKKLCDQCKLERVKGFFGHGLRLYYADTVTLHRLGLGC